MESNKVGKTGVIVAYFKGLSDIALAKKISKAIGAKRETLAFTRSVLGGKLLEISWFSPFMELRHKSIDALLKRFGAKRILELASGFSPRGIVFTSNRSKKIYVEVDLPDVIHEKARIASILPRLSGGHLKKGYKNPNLYFYPADVLSLEELELAAEPLSDGNGYPISVVHEGLFPYLNLAEKEKVAENIRCLLENCPGGLWITPDISMRSRLEMIQSGDSKMAELIELIHGQTGKDMWKNSFTDEDDAEGFFKKAGFNVQKFDQLDVVPAQKLSSFEWVLGRYEKKINPILSRAKIWVMSIK